MATNTVYEKGRRLSVAVASGVVAGDPVLHGELPGVAQTSRDAAGVATVQFDGVHNLSVKGIDGAGNVAVASGDALYFVTGDTPVLSKKRSGVYFGTALGAVTSGQTATIPVRLAGPGVGGGGITFAAAKVFVSTEQTGTGSSQNVAHGLGVAPAAVLVVPTELPDAAAETGFDIAEGAHTTTNVVVTVTNTVKFKVFAWA